MVTGYMVTKNARSPFLPQLIIVDEPKCTDPKLLTDGSVFLSVGFLLNQSCFIVLCVHIDLQKKLFFLHPFAYLGSIYYRVHKYQKQNEDCQELAMNIYENRKDFKRMFDEAKDWKSLVDLSKKALTSSGLEITFKLREVGNKIAVEDSIAEKAQNQLNKAVKPKVMK